jgi:hypothetical protein
MLGVRAQCCISVRAWRAQASIVNTQWTNPPPTTKPTGREEMVVCMFAYGGQYIYIDFVISSQERHWLSVCINRSNALMGYIIISNQIILNQIYCAKKHQYMTVHNMGRSDIKDRQIASWNTTLVHTFINLGHSKLHYVYTWTTIYTP